tara:strand:+ start:5355 stop:7850 length:2496 start_codon:yes stop_codon:yes gene_type:complete
VLTFDTALTSALANSNTTAFWVLKLYYNDESAFIGVSDRHRQDGTDIYYGIVANFGTYRQSLDFFNFTTTIGNMNVTLINTESSIKGGRFSDLLATNNFANRKWELFLNANNTTTLDTAARMIASGIISGDINYDENNVTLTLFDNSSKYHKRIPANTVDSSTYTNAPTKNIGKPIPMAYGNFHEKTDIGTIPTSHFDRFYNFYNGAFPAIVTDKWDVQGEETEAKVDIQAVNALDAENIYVFKDGYYPTLTDSNISVANNPQIGYRGNTASVFIPISTSNLASESGSGEYSVSSEERVGDGSFSAVALWTAESNVTNNSIATMTFALPKVNKLGTYADISALVKWGTVSDFEGANSESFRYTANSTNSDHDTITDDSETKESIAGLYSGKTATWDFEGSLLYTLLGGSDNAEHTAEIAETGAVIDFKLEDFAAHDVQELYEGGPISMTLTHNYTGPETLVMGYDFNIYSRTITGLTPTKIDYVYCSGKGRQYGAYIDADSRNQGYNTNALIENPIFIIESILRSELGPIYTGSGTSTTSNKLVDSNAAFLTSVVGQTLYNIKDKTSAMVTARDSGTQLSISADIMASGESYVIGGLTSDEIDYATFDESGNTTDGFLKDIYEDAIADIKFAFSQYKFINSKDILERLGRLCFSYIFISGDGKFKIKTLRRTDDYSSSDQTVNFNDINLNKIGKTPLGLVKNSILVKYNHDYAANQNRFEATATDSTSQGTTVNGFNKIMKLELNANEILDSTTATKLAEAFIYITKNRHDIIEFNTSRPKYNHLEIGDIIDFSNWNSKLELYGAAMSGYFIISDISKITTGCSIKAIKVS